MSAFDLQKSLERARRRLGVEPAGRQRARRADRGTSRLDPAVIGCVAEALSDQERPRMREMLARIHDRCREIGHTPPSRATIYKLMATAACPSSRKDALPAPVQSTLYNLDADSLVPAHQLAFHCFNYGDLKAVSFAAGLPWLAIYQALRLQGYRKKSRGLAEAVAKVRRI